MKIKEMEKLEKPRERLINYGVNSLSNEELIAIILSSGTKNLSSKDLSNIILKEIGGIENLKNITFNKLLNIKGVGSAKACQVIASLELGKRTYYVKNKKNIKISNTNDIYEIYKSEFDNQMQEKFCAIYLDTKKNVIKFKTLFKGTLDKSIVHPREIFKEAILLSANAIIVMHNHPSGDPTPSVNDIEITNCLIKTGQTIGINLIDHIIFGNNYYYSFFEKSHNK